MLSRVAGDFRRQQATFDNPADDIFLGLGNIEEHSFHVVILKSTIITAML